MSPPLLLNSCLLVGLWLVLGVKLIPSVSGSSPHEVDDNVDELPCRLYWAPIDDEAVNESRWVLYAGVSIAQGQMVEEHLVVPIVNANKNEYSPWHDILLAEANIPSAWRFNRTQQQREQLSNSATTMYQRDFLASSLVSLTLCSEAHNNVALGQLAGSTTAPIDENNSVNDPETGLPIHTHQALIRQTIALTNIPAGSLIVRNCGEKDKHRSNLTSSPASVSISELQTKGICVDNSLQVIRKNSSRKGSPSYGPSVVSRRIIAQRQVLATSPVLLLDRSQTEIVRQSYFNANETNTAPNESTSSPLGPQDVPQLLPSYREHGIVYTSQGIGQQLLLNYLFGHADSNVMMLPLGPGVNFINHDSTQPNVHVRWSKDGGSKQLRKETHVMDLYEMKIENGPPLLLEYVALRDIQAKEEIFLDYGRSYSEAWAQWNDVTRPLDPIQKQNTPFRYEIGLPDQLFPPHWMKNDPNPKGDFVDWSLDAGELIRIRWRSKPMDAVTPWAFRLGLNPRVRSVLLDYCNRMGITDILRHVTIDGNGIVQGEQTTVELEGGGWYLQRPDSKWKSNMHWFSPKDARAHEHYLQALSVAGFDDVLNHVADSLDMDGLVVYQLTFIGVSFASRGFVHYDVRATGAKAYNIIIPLILAHETGPELDLQGRRPQLDDTGRLRTATTTGRYRYRYDEAVMMGDDALHATSACDYRSTKEMRLAATVYVADINDENADEHVKSITQEYPPRGDVNLHKMWKARHWERGDLFKKLPDVDPKHILVRNFEATDSEGIGPDVDKLSDLQEEL